MVGNGKAGRFIAFGSFDAASNMAIDEAILEAHREGLVPPTLRVYQFEPAALSIGYSQKLTSEQIERITSKGFAVVRRPTGGRAVLHQNELTYSFIGSSVASNYAGDSLEQRIILSESVIGAYKQICRALILAFEHLGLTLEMGSSRAPGADKVDCFQATTVADLHFRGKKIVGSAQVRRRHAVLQHGSIILNQPQELMQELIDDDSAAKQTAPPLAHHANLYELLGRIVSVKELEAALLTGFEQAFSVEFEPSTLTHRELAISKELRVKYALNSSMQSLRL